MIKELIAYISDPGVPMDDRIRVVEEAGMELKKMREYLSQQACYCPECKKYHDRADCKMSIEEVIETVCTNPYNGYLDPYEYEEQATLKQFLICPHGHKTLFLMR